MLRVPLPLFVSFMLAAGEQRVAEIQAFKSAKHGGAIGDFYAPLREDLIAHSQGRREDQELVDAIAKLPDARKRAIFPPCAAGYLKALRETTATGSPHAAPSTVLQLGQVELLVAPELAFEVEGRPTAIQLWYLGEPCTERRVRLTVGLLGAALGSAYPGTAFAVLDLPRGRLLRSGKPVPHLDALARAEAEAFAQLAAAV